MLAVFLATSVVVDNVILVVGGRLIWNMGYQPCCSKDPGFVNSDHWEVVIVESGVCRPSDH